jgi:hypothetical protein
VGGRRQQEEGMLLLVVERIWVEEVRRTLVGAIGLPLD